MFLASLDQRETQEVLVVLVFVVILEMSDPQDLLVTLVYLRHPLWLRESEDHLVLKVCLVIEDLLVLKVAMDFQVSLVTLEILVWRVLLASAVHLAGRETVDRPVNLVKLATLVPLAQMVHRVLPVLQDQCLRLMASSSPATARVRMFPSVLMELTPSMTVTPCSMCRVTRGHTDRILALPAAVCAGSAPCPSCSATSTTSATSPPATTTPTGCPRLSPCPCLWPPSPERASSLSSAGVQYVKLRPW